MIKPAILYKKELEKLFAEHVYSKKFYYYSGYGGEYFIPEIRVEPNRKQLVVLDSNEQIIGYICYRINLALKDIYDFGLFGFAYAPRLGKELEDILQELLAKFNRIEWSCVDNNPVLKIYIKFCEENNGRFIHLHDCLVDEDGEIRGRYIFEILRKDYLKYLKE